MAASKKSFSIIVPPTTATLVYVTGQFPAFAIQPTEVVETTVTFKPHPESVLRMVPHRKTKVKTKNVKIDRTEHVTREFPAAESILTRQETGAAVALALRLVEDGAVNVKIVTLDGQYNVPVNGTTVRRLNPKKKAA